MRQFFLLSVLYQYFCGDNAKYELLSESKKMVIERNLRVTSNFYKKNVFQLPHGNRKHSSSKLYQ